MWLKINLGQSLRLEIGAIPAGKKQELMNIPISFSIESFIPLEAAPQNAYLCANHAVSSCAIWLFWGDWEE
jgi:hypothetical protein